MSFSEKKKHFESSKKKQQLQSSLATSEQLTKASESSTIQLEQQHFSSTENNSKRNFSYLSQNELEKLREEEVKKLSHYSEQQLRSIMSADEDSEEDGEETFESRLENGATTSSMHSEEKVTSGENGGSRRSVFRTAKAEKLYYAKMGIDVDSAEYLQMTPTQRRAAEAEKRKEWRQARLKSLEDDPTMTLLSMKNYDHWAEQIEEDEVDGNGGNAADN